MIVSSPRLPARYTKCDCNHPAGKTRTDASDGSKVRGKNKSGGKAHLREFDEGGDVCNLSGGNIKQCFRCLVTELLCLDGVQCLPGPWRKAQ